MSRGQGNGHRTKTSTENGNKKFEKISKKHLTNNTKYGIISMSVKGTETKPKRVWKRKQKRLDKQTKIWYNDYTEKREDLITLRIVVFDTETTSLKKPFCYNIGYIIYDTETGEKLIKHDFVAEQIWHNRELFTTAYYAEKRDEYINRMRGKTCEMKKLGHITQIMCREFADFEVVAAFAYNSPFDDKVFTFNCEWFKIKNPFDNIPIFDIRGYVHRKLAFVPEYKKFCENNEYYTESGNYSTTAETVYRFLTNNTEFIEEHTALADAEIELDILLKCIELGCEWNKEYKVYRTIQRVVDKQLEVKDTEGEKHYFPYNRITVYKEKNNRTRICLKRLENN